MKKKKSAGRGGPLGDLGGTASAKIPQYLEDKNHISFEI